MAFFQSYHFLLKFGKVDTDQQQLWSPAQPRISIRKYNYCYLSALVQTFYPWLILGVGYDMLWQAINMTSTTVACNYCWLAYASNLTSSNFGQLWIQPQLSTASYNSAHYKWPINFGQNLRFLLDKYWSTICGVCSLNKLLFSLQTNFKHL